MTESTLQKSQGKPHVRKKADRTVIALDLGGTKIAAALVTDRGKILVRHQVLTDAQAGRERILDRLAEAAHTVWNEVKQHQTVPEALGIATPGLMDYERGMIRFATSTLVGWTGTPLQREMQDRVGLPCRIENDANAGAWAEYCWGAGEAREDLLYISVGTGIGGGLVLGGRLVPGAVGGAGGFGHVSIDRHGERCYCGNYGCVELYAGGKSIAKRLRDNSLGLPFDSTDGSSPEELREIRQIITWAHNDTHEKNEHTKVAQDVLRQMGEALGCAAASSVNLVNPSLVVIGGGIVHGGSYLLDPLATTLQERTFPPVGRHVRVAAARLGSDAGLLGAALTALGTGVETGSAF